MLLRVFSSRRKLRIDFPKFAKRSCLRLVSSVISPENSEFQSEIHPNTEPTIDQKQIDTFKSLIGNLNKKKEAPSNATLLKRQIKVEEEQMTDAVLGYTSSMEKLMKMGKGSSVKFVQRNLLAWYEPLVSAINAEVMNLFRAKSSGIDYKSHLLLLPVEKIAVITLDTAVNGVLRHGNYPARLTYLAMEISDLIESEVNLMKLKRGKDSLLPWQRLVLSENTPSSQRAAKILGRKLRSIAKADEWEQPTKAKLGAFLINLLVNSAKTEAGKSVFIYKLTHDPKSMAKVGTIHMMEEVFEEMSTKDLDLIMPRYLPMLVPPKPWVPRQFYGAYYRLKTPLMRAMIRSQREVLIRASIDRVLEGLNYLGSVGWVINEPVLAVIKQAWEQGMLVGELPPVGNLPMPSEESCFRKPSEMAARHSRQKVAAASNSEAVEEKAVFDEQFYNEMCRRVAKKNSEFHSLRCDLRIKLAIADRFAGQKMYFPYNMDFRGRTYPIPPNLSHLGSDLCRGLLLFDEAKPLGKQGLMWMKVHLCNLFGNNKIPQEERVKWTDDHMRKVRDSAKNPLTGQKWWATAENPFQALATCMELTAALESEDPEQFLSRLPIHQDGSCNGLQHYAGLGRDELGGRAVNLLSADKPQDVYSKVLEIVNAQIAQDCTISETAESEQERAKGVSARMVRGVVNRKVIKQTVMTSVYGVTTIGARAQVQARLEELMFDDKNVVTPEKEKEIYRAALYVANLTLASLQKMFVRAKEIMDWLAKCSLLVAKKGHAMSWVTPMGLPVIQPYRKIGQHNVKTVMQSVTLTVNNELLPVESRKQRSAFPPNFVHSLDATHMLMTCLRMKESNLVFAAVHDSYWTHAADVPRMSEVLRECFVELYEYPVLEDLRESLVMRFPDTEFPEIPKRGNLVIQDVLKSKYFFH